MKYVIEKRVKYLLAFLLIYLLAVSSVYGCFAVVAGKNTTTDGSVLFGHLEQNGGLRNMSYLFVPEINHEPGSVIHLYRGGRWPQAAVTYAYLWSANTGVEFGDGYFNQWGVAIASDACPTREDPYDALVARGDITDGGIGYMLRRIVAQRARSAREGVMIAGELLDYFGYASSGRTYVIADAREAWILAVAKGKNWIAQRVPDDEIVLLPNVHIIGAEADINDKKNVIASEGLVEYAISRGWYDPSGGKPFSFREAFAAPPPEESFMAEQGADPRQWFSQSLVHGKLIELPVAEPLPFSIKPGRKLNVLDIADLIRTHGHIDGQPPDPGLAHLLGVSDNTTPHRQGGTGNICSGRSQELVVYQLRDWLPVEVGSLAWRTTGAPCGSVLVPWYAGITETPRPYHKSWELEEALQLDFHFNPPAGTFDNDPQNAFDVFRELENLIDLNYIVHIKKARELWDPFEQDQFVLQHAVEKVALELIAEDRDLAKRFLTGYSGYRAIKALGLAKEMVNQLKTMHSD